MPELPDVEVFRRYLDDKARHRTIKHVTVRDDRVLAVSPTTLRRRLTDRHVASSARHGKYLFAVLDDGASLVLHFGMTGFLRYTQEAVEPERHDVVVLHFDNGGKLSYHSQRKIGSVGVADDYHAFIAQQELGPDALDVDLDALRQILGDSRSMLKTLLMDQRKMAGLGNVYSDEILFQSRLHPRDKAAEIDNNSAQRLHETLRKVLTETVDRQADPAQLPRTWLTPHRHKGAACPRCGTQLGIAPIGGRTTYWCPQRQGRGPSL